MIPLDIEAAKKGSLRQLADDLFWARFDLPFRLNHINLYVLAVEVILTFQQNQVQVLSLIQIIV